MSEVTRRRAPLVAGQSIGFVATGTLFLFAVLGLADGAVGRAWILVVLTFVVVLAQMGLLLLRPKPVQWQGEPVGPAPDSGAWGDPPAGSWAEPQPQAWGQTQTEVRPMVQPAVEAEYTVGCPGCGTVFRVTQAQLDAGSFSCRNCGRPGYVKDHALDVSTIKPEHCQTCGHEYAEFMEHSECPQCHTLNEY